MFDPMAPTTVPVAAHASPSNYRILPRRIIRMELFNAENLQTKSPTNILAKYKKLLGPAPVLTSEDLKAYDAIMESFTECIEPTDLITLMLVKDLTDSTWDILRYSRHMTLLIEREHLKRQDIEQKRRQQEQKRKQDIARRVEERKKAKCAEENKQTGNQTNPPTQASKLSRPARLRQAGGRTTQYKRMLDLEEVIDSTVPDVDEILDAPADEVDHAAALQSGIEYHETLFRLRSVAIGWRNDTLKLIEFRSQYLGQRLRRVSNDIIDGECSETNSEAPSIAGPDGDER